MLFKKLIRTILTYKAQFISMIIMIALGIGVFLGFNMEWYTLKKNTDGFLAETGFSDYRIVSEAGFSTEQLNAVKSAEGVKNATLYVSADMTLKGYEKTNLAVTVSTDIAVSGIYLTEGEEYSATDTEGVWISDQFAKNNKISCGDEVVLSFNNVDSPLKVRGLIKAGEYLICLPSNSVQMMPDYEKYGFAYLSPAAYGALFGQTYYPQINVLSDLDKKDFVNVVENSIGSYLVIPKEDTVSYSESRGEIEEGIVMGSILPVLFLAIAVLTMITTMHRITAAEKTQIGTLKALGFKNKRIIKHYSSYAFAIGVIGTILGVGIGYLLCWYIMNPNGAMGTYIDMPDWSLKIPVICWAVIAVIICFLVLIGFLSVRKVLKGSAADTLRPYVPSRVKSLKLEKTGLWKKMKFGARWNLRDVSRHKSRTFMTLFGIIGCLVLCVGGLGMSDTIDGFVNVFYYGAINYEYKLNVNTDNAENAAIRALAATYDGDYSASAAVQLEDKTVNLEIYNVANDKVKFIDRDMRYTALKDDGAYVCVRIADRLNLKVGDEITFSPYGENTEFTVKIAGVLRSMTENIVMTENYAASVTGFDYKINTVYTDVDGITVNEIVSDIQTKENIIKSFDKVMTLMVTMVALLIIAAVILGIVVLYNLGVMSYTERYREMATLKVVGFKDKQIGKILIGQNLWLTLAGVFLGIPAGIGVLQYLLNALAGEYEMKLMLGWKTFLISTLLTFGVSLIVGLMISGKNKKINMVEALKGQE